MTSLKFKQTQEKAPDPNFPYIFSKLTKPQRKQAFDLLNYYQHVLICPICRVVYGIDKITLSTLKLLKNGDLLCYFCTFDNGINKPTYKREQFQRRGDNETHT